MGAWLLLKSLQLSELLAKVPVILKSLTIISPDLLHADIVMYIRPRVHNKAIDSGGSESVGGKAN